MSDGAQSRPGPFARWALRLVLGCVVLDAASYIAYTSVWGTVGDSGTDISSATMMLCLNVLCACVPVLLAGLVLAVVSLFRERARVRAVIALVLAVLMLVLTGPIFVFWALPALGFSF